MVPPGGRVSVAVLADMVAEFTVGGVRTHTKGKRVGGRSSPLRPAATGGATKLREADWRPSGTERLTSAPSSRRTSLS